MIPKHSDYYPKPDAQRKERAIQESVQLFRQQGYGAARRPVFASWGQWKPFAAGMMAATLVLGLFYHYDPARLVQPPSVATEELALLREMKQVFGNRLEAVVQQGGTIEPVVSASSTYTDAQPVMITLREGSKEIRITSYSGNTVTLSVDHKEQSFSPTVTGDGKVIVEGTNFIWSHGKTTGDAPFSIDAKTLGKSL